MAKTKQLKNRLQRRLDNCDWLSFETFPSFKFGSVNQVYFSHCGHTRKRLFVTTDGISDKSHFSKCNEGQKKIFAKKRIWFGSKKKIIKITKWNVILLYVDPPFIDKKLPFLMIKLTSITF